MSLKCVYGEHGMQGSFCPTAPEPGMPCEPEPTTKLDPADFASLLEREPAPERHPDIWVRREHERCARELEDYGYPNAARILRNGPDSLDERLKADSQTSALDSAAERIKSLESVLVALRNMVAAARQGHRSVLDDALQLLAETLDPCKPWCVLEPGHSGACEPHELERDQ